MTSQLKVDRISPANGSGIIIDGFGGGAMQVVEETIPYDINHSTTSGTYIDIGLNLSITPEKANSKIIIHANTPYETTGTSALVDVRILEDSTSTTVSELIATGCQVSGGFWYSLNQAGVYQCSSTNQLTFKCQVRRTSVSGNDGVIYYRGQGGLASDNPRGLLIYAMEVPQ